MTIINSDHFKQLLERFDNSSWLHRVIKDYAERNTGWNNKWKSSVISFYRGILTEIFAHDELSAIYSEFEEIPIHVFVTIANSTADNIYVVASKVAYNYSKSDIISGINFHLYVTDAYPENTTLLINELDSIIGHEIEHIIQRIKISRNSYFSYKQSKNYDDIHIVSDLSYAKYLSRYGSNFKSVYYYLKKSEFDSFAYSVGMWFWYYFGSESHKALQYIAPLIWSNADNVTFHGEPIDQKIVDMLKNYAFTFKQAEEFKILKDNLTAKDLWIKFIKEIYKYIDSRDENHA